MKVRQGKAFSRHLEREMEFRVYGVRGQPLLVFPTGSGRFFQYEDFGMIEVIRPFIDSGKIQVWTCDGIDDESFFAKDRHPADKIRWQARYDRYVAEEMAGLILAGSRARDSGNAARILLTGCSMGAYHSANFYFRHPEIFGGVIALSGVYGLDRFFGEYMDEAVYLHSPIHYLANLSDSRYLEAFRRGKIVLCSGQGAYEEEAIEDTLRMKEILDDKKVPAWVDLWGGDVNHDWPWWKKQIVYFLECCV